MSDNTKESTVIKASADDAKFYWLNEGRSAGGFVREIDHSLYHRGTHPLFNGIKIVDCDTHFTEPPDLFTRDAPAAMKDKMPRVVKNKDGQDRWSVMGRDFGSYGGNVINTDRNKLLGKLSFTTYDDIHRGSYEVAPRLKEMDEMGIWAQICFHNSGVTQAGSLLALNDNDLVMAIVRRFNDACKEPQ